MATRWREHLEAWAIPPDILAAAPADPWAHPVSRFAGRADRAVAEADGISFERAAEVLRPSPGSVLDVGAGAGAASLPLHPWATEVTAVDTSPDMLAAFRERADGLGLVHREIEGRWPDAAPDTGVHDVVVAHHVVFNVPDLVPFLQELDAHATRRVVLELPPHHPLSWMNFLWEQFHDLARPSGPTAGDVVEILSELGYPDLQAEYWVRHDPSAAGGGVDETLEERAAQVTQRLCLPPERAPEVAAAIKDVDAGYHRDVVTISWTPGSAPRSDTLR
jgi:SAM-dependent methyltransferase